MTYTRGRRILAVNKYTALAFKHFYEPGIGSDKMT